MGCFEAHFGRVPPLFRAVKRFLIKVSKGVFFVLLECLIH